MTHTQFPLTPGGYGFEFDNPQPAQPVTEPTIKDAIAFEISRVLVLGIFLISMLKGVRK